MRGEMPDYSSNLPISQTGRKHFFYFRVGGYKRAPLMNVAVYLLSYKMRCISCLSLLLQPRVSFALREREKERERERERELRVAYIVDP